MKILNKKLNVVIVAGASGIGREIASAYYKEGCNVFVCDISQKSIDSFKGDLPNIFTYKTDVSVYKEVVSFFKKISSEVDSIDVLVNCAGIAGPTNSLENIDPDEWDKTIKTNLNSHFYFTKFSIPLLKKVKIGRAHV